MAKRLTKVTAGKQASSLRHLVYGTDSMICIAGAKREAARPVASRHCGCSQGNARQTTKATSPASAAHKAAKIHFQNPIPFPRSLIGEATIARYGLNWRKSGLRFNGTHTAGSRQEMQIKLLAFFALAREPKKKLDALGVECHLVYPGGPQDVSSSQVERSHGRAAMIPQFDFTALTATAP
jgi:hypothetical protein